MANLDYVIIAVYLILVVGAGFIFQLRAKRSEEKYFLGERKVHWLFLSMSGSVSTFDVTGTMWIVSLFFLIGMRGMWVHWMWGFMMGAFFMSYTGKWVQRSKVFTAAEWMKTRFGDDTAGQMARLAYTILAIVYTVGVIGYAFEGVGKFASQFIPLSDNVCAIILMGLVALYVIPGGFVSVVVTDVAQTVLVTIACIAVCIIMFTDTSLAAIATKVPEGWFSIMPEWKIEYLQDTPYHLFGILVIVWVSKGLLLNAGGPAQLFDFQRFLSAPSAKDACKIGGMWSVFLLVRWAMTMGITVVAIVHFGHLVTDPEKAMPIVIHKYFPIGIRGMFLGALFSAFMGTFNSTVNAGASYLVKDIYEKFIDQNPTQKRQMIASYTCSTLIILGGFLVGINARSIADIWNWLMLALGAGILLPNVLRWYWWRFNGWGFTWGTLGGTFLSILQSFFWRDAPFHIYFPVIAIFSLVISISATLLTKPVQEELLINFYKSVQPGGFWRTIHRKTLLRFPNFKKTDVFSLDLLNALLGMIAIACAYLAVVYIMIHQIQIFTMLIIITLIASAILYFTWYRRLPEF